MQKTPNASIAWQLALKQAELIATLSQKMQLSEVGKMTLQAIKTSVLKFIKDEDGLTVVEYAVAGGLIAAVTVAAFRALGVTVTGVITGINAALAG